MKTTVKDIMVPVDQYPCIPDTLNIGDAVIEMTVQIRMRDKGMQFPRVALVFDDDFNDLRGMLRRRDIMRGLEPRFLMTGSLDYARKLFEIDVDPNLSELSYDKMRKGMRKRAKRLVKEVMRPIRATIGHDDHVIHAMCAMVDQDTSLLPVLDNSNVVGVVRSVDVMREIALVL